MKHLKYILVALFFINIQVAHADLEVKEVKHSTTTNPCNGEITVDAIGPSNPLFSAGPFTIVLTHPNGMEESFGPFDGTHTFTGLCGGTYIICINNRFDCGACYERVVEDCSDIEVTAEIKGFCGFIRGSIQLTIEGGIPPFTFKWFEGCEGEPFSTDKDVVDLDPNQYCVEIVDSRGCVIEKEYTILHHERMKLSFDQERWCSIGDRLIINVNGQDGYTEFTYDWSDGENEFTGKFYSRILRQGITYRVTVTNDITGCSSKSGDLKAQIFNKWDDLTITDVQGDKCNGSPNEGRVSFHLQRIPNYSPYKVITYKNGDYNNPIHEELWNWDQDERDTWSKYHAYGLTGGDNFCFKFFDNKGCFVAEACADIPCCPEDDLGISVTINRYNCDDDIITATSDTRGYTNCRYTWTEFDLSGGRIQSKVTDVPMISGNFVKTLRLAKWQSFCVKMDCGCEEAEHCDNQMDKCCKGIDFDLSDGFKKVSHLCYGDIGDHYTYEGTTTAKIDLKIKLSSKSNFRKGPKGLDKYEKKIQSMRWTDDNAPIVNDNYHRKNNYLTISRDITSEGDYCLEIIDGFGCVFSECFTVRNLFSYDKTKFCVYKIFCGETLKETKVGELFIYPIPTDGSDICAANIICGLDNKSKPFTGNKVNCSEYLYDPIADKCTYECECDFFDLDGYDYESKNTETVDDCCQYEIEDYWNLEGIEIDCEAYCGHTFPDVAAIICNAKIRCHSAVSSEDPYWNVKGKFVKWIARRGDSPGPDKNCFIQALCEYTFIGRNGVSTTVEYERYCTYENRTCEGICYNGGEPENPISHNNTLYREGIRFSPNPFSNQFNITIDQAIDYSDYNIAIYNTLGQEVSFSIQDHPSGFVIDLEGVADNMYFVLIKDGNGEVVHMEKMVSM